MCIVNKEEALKSVELNMDQTGKPDQIKKYIEIIISNYLKG